MRAHLEALAVHLAPLGVRIHLFRANNDDAATTPPIPYFVLSGRWSVGEEAVNGPNGTRDGNVTIVCVDDRAANAELLQRRALDLLPLGEWVRLDVTGRVVHVKCTDTTEATVDLDMRLPNSNRHPGVGHILLDLNSTPRS